MTVFNLAYANIKNHKSASISLFVLIVIAGLLLNVGLTIMTQIQVFYDDKVAELQDAHLSVMTRSAEHSDEYHEYFSSYAGVSKVESRDVLLLEGTSFRYGDTDLSITTLLLDAEAERSVSPLQLIEQLPTESDRDLYLPYSLQTDGRYALGDTFTLHYLDRAYEFRVAGFFETTMYGTHNMGVLKLLLPHASYERIASDLDGHADAIQLSVVLADGEQASQLYRDFKKQHSDQVGEGGDSYWILDIQTAKYASTITVNIVAMILVAFAAVMIIVSLIVIKFRVTNSIEDGMVNLGVLKAVGYTNRQIITSINLQFLLITCCAGIVGVGLSYLVLPALGLIIASLTGLIWSQRFSWSIDTISVMAVVLLVLAVTGSAAYRIRKLFPVTALRGGLTTHSFRRNHFPLDRAKGGLSVLLAGKTIFANRKMSITIGLIMAAVTFAAVFSIVLYYNIAVNNTAFVHLTGVETSDVIVVGKPEADSEELLAAIQDQEGVSKVVLWDGLNAIIDGQSFFTRVSDDYSKLENHGVYEGRYPIHDNEIVISWLIADQLDKSIGDTVEVTLGESTRTYLVTGLNQSINNMGLVAYLPLVGLQQQLPQYEGKVFNVYMDDLEPTAYMERMIREHGALISEIVDIEETLASQMSVYSSIMYVVMVLILAITTLVVVLILYLVIKTMIIKRKKEYGIQKASGYTTWQLMNQVALSFVPIVALGVAVGCLLGSLYTNPLLSILLSGAGVKNVSFTIDLTSIIVLCGGVVVLAYLVSVLVSRRIRRISPYELITE